MGDKDALDDVDIDIDVDVDVDVEVDQQLSSNPEIFNKRAAVASKVLPKKIRVASTILSTPPNLSTKRCTNLGAQTSM